MDGVNSGEKSEGTERVNGPTLKPTRWCKQTARSAKIITGIYQNVTDIKRILSVQQMNSEIQRQGWAEKSSCFVGGRARFTQDNLHEFKVFFIIRNHSYCGLLQGQPSGPEMVP